uniref:NS3 protein n=1 Tax=Epizootic hemorrhagic disease virus TaxID=40054 RepID=A0SQD2_9REOV|nr:NS3 protein [Epizootic hemorrhagic disease virus]ABK41164.1 NS3 protein [Epizootic hemorrhagic disease virus]ABK41165.1 NS3 protein [Epizootic hemorrhagic disease virus]
MLSRLVPGVETRIEMKASDEVSLVPYQEQVRPPSYVPSAPIPTAMPKVALDILDKAMSNQTGATMAQKVEKVAYASYAEAFRDDLRLRQIKKHVNEQVLPKMRVELTAMKRRRAMAHMILIIAAVVALITSASTLTSDLGVILKHNTTTEAIQTYIKPFCAAFGIINLAATMVMMFMAKNEKIINQQIDHTRKEIMKKDAYNEAVRMSMTEFSGIPLDGFDIPPELTR